MEVTYMISNKKDLSLIKIVGTLLSSNYIFQLVLKKKILKKLS